MLRRRNGRKDLNYIFPCFRCGEKSALILITLYYLHIYYIYYILCMFLRAAAASDLKIRTHRNGPEEMGAVSAEARLRSAARARGRVATSSLSGNLVANWRASGYHKAIGWALSSCSSRR